MYGYYQGKQVLIVCNDEGLDVVPVLPYTPQLFFGDYIVEKGYEFVWEDIEISRKGIDQKK